MLSDAGVGAPDPVGLPRGVARPRPPRRPPRQRLDAIARHPATAPARAGSAKPRLRHLYIRIHGNPEGVVVSHHVVGWCSSPIMSSSLPTTSFCIWRRFRSTLPPSRFGAHCSMELSWWSIRMARCDLAKLSSAPYAETGVSRAMANCCAVPSSVDEHFSAIAGVRQLWRAVMLSASHVRKVFEAAKRCQLINGYGPTEATTFSVCFPSITSRTDLSEFPSRSAVRFRTRGFTCWTAA